MYELTSIWGTVGVDSNKSIIYAWLAITSESEEPPIIYKSRVSVRGDND
jgi:hypothetical protein